MRGKRHVSGGVLGHWYMVGWGSDNAACYIGDEEGACLAFGQGRRGGDCSASRAGRVALIDDR